MADSPQPRQSHPPPGDAAPLNSTDPGSAVTGPGACYACARGDAGPEGTRSTWWANHSGMNSASPSPAGARKGCSAVR